MRKKSISMLTAAVLTVCFCVTILFTALPAASAATATDIAAQLSGISGLSASVSGSTVTVTGAANIGTTGLTLNLSGVTINWNASLTGRATANNYLLTLSGNGIFNLANTISNTTGAGGTVYISGAIQLNVNASGEILSPGSGSAVTTANGITSASINVNSGGRISSTPNGYAINDGAGFDYSSNNTVINVNSGGIVEAGSASAIRSTGVDSVVNILGGTVTNAATNNINPAIMMNCAPPPDMPVPSKYNVYVNSGSLVGATNSGGYAIQSSQSVLIRGGEIQAIGGRAISLVGMNSLCRVEGGHVATVSGDAISTATTTLELITNAKIEVAGGIVEATGTGNALRITGTNSTATISGGQVLAKSGNAVIASNNATGTGKPANVFVTGGFVFAWGSSIEGGSNVIAPAGRLSRTGGVIVAWRTTTGVGTVPYHFGDNLDLSMEPAGSVSWHDRGTENYNDDGITIPLGAPITFFRLNVEVYSNLRTLTVINGIDGTSVDYKVKEGATFRIIARPEEPIKTGINPGAAGNETNGDKFYEWTSSHLPNVGNPSSSSTTFEMPNSDATVTANFRPRYLLHVDGLGANIVAERNFGGSASYGYYAEGDEIFIQASYGYASAGFLQWITPDGGLVENATHTATKYTMPGNKTTVTATVGVTTVPQPNPHTTTVTNGIIQSTTTGTPPSSPPNAHRALTGTGLRIEANIPAGNVFTGWTSTSGGWFTDANSPNTIFIMPDNDTAITATYAAAYTLNVINGTAIETGPYKAGDEVHIVADIIPGKHFDEWRVIEGGVAPPPQFASTIFTMPAANSTVEAEIIDNTYELWVWNGKDRDFGSAVAQHYAGDIVNVEANLPPDGMEFAGWIVAMGYDVATGQLITLPNTLLSSFRMPADDVILIATYAEPPPPAPSSDDLDDHYPTGDRNAKHAKQEPTPIILLTILAGACILYQPINKLIKNRRKMR